MYVREVPDYTYSISGVIISFIYFSRFLSDIPSLNLVVKYTFESRLFPSLFHRGITRSLTHSLIYSLQPPFLAISFLSLPFLSRPPFLSPYLGLHLYRSSSVYPPIHSPTHPSLRHNDPCHLFKSRHTQSSLTHSLTHSPTHPEN